MIDHRINYGFVAKRWSVVNTKMLYVYILGTRRQINTTTTLYKDTYDIKQRALAFKYSWQAYKQIIYY